MRGGTPVAMLVLAVKLICTRVQEDVLLYGGEGAGDLRPEFVPKLNWLLATDFMPSYTGTVPFSSLAPSASAHDWTVCATPASPSAVCANVTRSTSVCATFCPSVCPKAQNTEYSLMPKAGRGTPCARHGQHLSFETGFLR